MADASTDELALVFASLTSADLRTSHGMEKILDTIYNQDDSSHHGKFVRRNARELAATKSPSFSPDSSGLSSGFTTEADLDDDEVTSLEASECYILSLSAHARPFDPRTGWWFGTGDPDRFPNNGGVDILIPPVAQLSLPSSSSSFVYPRQGYFAFDPNYGQLWLHARHKGIKVDGRSLGQRSKALLPKRTRISIGPYRYIFEFKISDEPEFQKNKRDHLSLYQGGANPHEAKSATPSANDVLVQGWRLHGVVGASYVSVIHAATNVKSGEVVAVIRLHFGSTRAKAEEEVQLYRDIRASVIEHRYSSFVMHMHSVLEDERTSSSVREVYLLWKPLARGDFSEFGTRGSWRTESEAVKKTLFVQVLLGAQAFHECGWIHRDIKPANLGVVDFGDKPRAIILDEGQAIRQIQGGYKPRTKHCGTVGFLAPEIENAAFVPFYDTKVDVWSLGAVGYFLFFGGRIPWSVQYNMFVPVTNSLDPSLYRFREVHDGLIAQPPGTLAYLVGQMLNEDPRQRPNILEVLAHPALKSECEAIKRNLDDQKSAGRKRSRDV